MTGPLDSYLALIKNNNLQPDSSQQATIQQLQNLHEQLLAAHYNQSKYLTKLLMTIKIITPPPVPGLYIWGDVGRGKTLLVDIFFDALPFSNKLRLHFHRFMRRVHSELATLQNTADPLQIVANNFAKDATIICFDEFFVSDITDAMILARLLDKLFALGITIVATSNIPPEELYQGGLQRAQFLPAIALLKQHLMVLHLSSNTDYRLRTLTHIAIYHYPADNKALQLLEDYFIKLAPTPGLQNHMITIENRNITAMRVADDIIWFDCYALCDGPRNQADYIELARCYHTVFISNVPIFTENNEDMARRFIAVIDEFYDRKVKLIIAAATNLASDVVTFLH